MNQETVVHHIGDSCYADERRIHAIHGLQLHPDVKTALYIHLKKRWQTGVKAGAAVAQLLVYSMRVNMTRKCSTHRPAVKNI